LASKGKKGNEIGAISTKRTNRGVEQGIKKNLPKGLMNKQEKCIFAVEL